VLVASENLPKKNRFVKKRMAANKAAALKVLRAPMSNPNADSMISRLLVAKSLPCETAAEELPLTDMSNSKYVAERLQLVTMACRNPLDERPAAGGQMNLNSSSILAAAAFADQLQSLTSANQCGRPMRTRLKPLGQLSHARPVSVRKAADMQ
jgi:hypothetical protein